MDYDYCYVRVPSTPPTYAEDLRACNGHDVCYVGGVFFTHLLNNACSCHFHANATRATHVLTLYVGELPVLRAHRKRVPVSRCSVCTRTCAFMPCE